MGMLSNARANSIATNKHPLVKLTELRHVRTEAWGTEVYHIFGACGHLKGQASQDTKATWEAIIAKGRRRRCLLCPPA